MPVARVINLARTIDDLKEKGSGFMVLRPLQAKHELYNYHGDVVS